MDLYFQNLCGPEGQNTIYKEQGTDILRWFFSQKISKYKHKHMGTVIFLLLLSKDTNRKGFVIWRARIETPKEVHIFECVFLIIFIEPLGRKNPSHK